MIYTYLDIDDTFHIVKSFTVSQICFEKNIKLDIYP